MMCCRCGLHSAARPGARRYRTEGLISRICTPVFAKILDVQTRRSSASRRSNAHGGNGSIATTSWNDFIENLLSMDLGRPATSSALDVFRSMQREPDTVDAFLAEIPQSAWRDARLDRFTERDRATTDN